MARRILDRLHPIALQSAILAATVVAARALQAQGVTGYYRFPTAGGGVIVFQAEGDLWKVPQSGGLATRLTTHRSEEQRPVISPDGRTIAFSAAYEGPTEVYTMPLDGGLPKRLTYDGAAARVISWTPDNRILYATTRFAGLPAVQLAEVDPDNARRSLLPLSQASDGMISGDGTLYFTRFDWQGSNTKRYRGGTAQSLWKWNSKDAHSEAAPLTAAYTGTSKAPMVFRNRLYFASDRANGTEKDPKPGVMNIWSSDLNGGDLRQITSHADYDVQTPTISPDGKIVYQQGADIWMVDVGSNGCGRDPAQDQHQAGERSRSDARAMDHGAIAIPFAVRTFAEWRSRGHCLARPSLCCTGRPGTADAGDTDAEGQVHPVPRWPFLERRQVADRTE